MSRIHDALKKAEQERVGTPRPQPATSTVEAPPPPAERQERLVPRPDEPPAESATPRQRVLPEVLTFETLLARCTVSQWSPDSHRIVGFQSTDPRRGGEEFRSLRSQLYQSRDTQPLRRLLITSPLPQEGKTYVSVNLAHSIVRQRERKALLIDADLRWSRLHTLLGTQLSPGLTEYLRGEADEVSVLQRGPLENLFFISGGKSAANAAELIANGRLKTLLDRLTPLFDWIILDSPPAVAMSDASLLAELCDGVLLVVASGKTPFDMAQKARQLLKKGRLLGVVLNKVEPRTVGSHYYYGYYHRKSETVKGQG